MSERIVFCGGLYVLCYSIVHSSHSTLLVFLDPPDSLLSPSHTVLIYVSDCLRK